jgi:phage terminase large subunit
MVTGNGKRRVKEFCNRQFYEAVNSKQRIKIFQGGSRSGKSWALMQYCLYLITTETKPITISIVRKTLPALKRSVLRDFNIIAKSLGVYYMGEFNKTELVFNYNGHTIEFFSADDAQKIRGSTRDVLWCEECNELNIEDFRQLSMRTKREILMSFNPSDPVHFIYDLCERDDADLFISTYRDNKFIAPEVKKELERLKKRDPDFWRVYGEGQRAVFSQRQIFRDWNYIDESEFPEELDWFMGCDFGYTNDPTAICLIAKKNDKVFVKEVLYKTGMTNRDIANHLKSLGLEDLLMYCDSAEPKSIEELKQMGILAKPAIKGAGSINAGLSLMREFDFYISNKATNVKSEQMKYVWEELKDGTIINKACDRDNHAMDCLRYGLYSRFKNRNEFFVI